VKHQVAVEIEHQHATTRLTRRVPHSCPVRLVEQSPLPVRHTLAKLGVPQATFCRWYDRYNRGEPEALNDRSPRPGGVWNRIPHGVRDNLIQRALDDRRCHRASWPCSEASVYRLLKARDLIASPAFIVIKAANAFKPKTIASNQLWQTDFTYLKVVGWGCSTCHFSRYPWDTWRPGSQSGVPQPLSIRSAKPRSVRLN
jgi:hypothetical protein